MCGMTVVVCAAGKHTFQPRGRYDRSSSFYDDVDHKASIVRPEDYIFPFENLVLEGGGNKGLAYCGAVRVSSGPDAQGESSLKYSDLSPLMHRDNPL